MNFAISDELDYSLLSLNERKEKVNDLICKYDNDLLDYFENYQKVNIGQAERTSEFDVVSKDLEKVADYLLYMDNKEQREKQKQEKVMNKRQDDKRKKKEFLTDNFTFVEEGKNEITRNVKIYGKIKVSEQDRKTYKELADTGRLIKSLKNQIFTKKDLYGNNLSNEKIKKMKWYLIDIGKEEIAIKEQLKKYITFKNICPSIPYYNLINFSFNNPLHIKALFYNYKQLKESTSHKTDNDFKILLFVFDELINKAIKEPILRKIFELKIDGEIQDVIKNEIFSTFNIDITRRRIAQIIEEVIPNLIAEQYKQDFEDWVFTFITKGKYKTCSNCNHNYLASSKYFHKDNYFEDGFKKNCKKCRKKK